MGKQTIDIDFSKPVELNIVSQSTHVVVYRVWKRVGDTGDWDKVQDGSTVDGEPDFLELGVLAAGTNLTYYLGIRGANKSAHRTVITVSQNAKIVKDGVVTEKGETDGDGYATAETELVLK